MPMPRCSIIGAAAALTRTAVKTITCWRQWIPQLEAVSAENLVLSRAHHPRERLLSPPCWDAPSFAENLQAAANCDYVAFSLRGKKSFFKPELDKFCASGFRSLQSKLYKLMLEKAYDPNNSSSFNLSILTRMIGLFLPYTVAAHIELEASLHALSGIGVGHRAKVLKTWLNGWVTSHRMSEPNPLKCIVGCAEEPDDLRHYLQCPRIFASVCFNIPGTSDNPLIRCGIQNASNNSLLIISCIFSAYHAVKAKIRASGSADHIDFAHYWHLFGQHFNAEAIECGLCDTLYSSAKFESFLNENSGPQHPSSPEFLIPNSV